MIQRLYHQKIFCLSLQYVTSKKSGNITNKYSVLQKYYNNTKEYYQSINIFLSMLFQNTTNINFYNLNNFFKTSRGLLLTLRDPHLVVSRRSRASLDKRRVPRANAPGSVEKSQRRTSTIRLAPLCLGEDGIIWLNANNRKRHFEAPRRVASLDAA